MGISTKPKGSMGFIIYLKSYRPLLPLCTQDLVGPEYQLHHLLIVLPWVAPVAEMSLSLPIFSTGLMMVDCM